MPLDCCRTPPIPHREGKGHSRVRCLPKTQNPHVLGEECGTCQEAPRRAGHSRWRGGPHSGSSGNSEPSEESFAGGCSPAPTPQASGSEGTCAAGRMLARMHRSAAGGT